mmetsp:Transcript_25750/g.41195  ORF Transcript_25750/g.41195 Transcript_25750/m.41195 type:complete len:310 (-) Transcript_25750:147-1076(-)
MCGPNSPCSSCSPVPIKAQLPRDPLYNAGGVVCFPGFASLHASFLVLKMHGQANTGGLPSSPLGPASLQLSTEHGPGEAIKLRRYPYTLSRKSGSGGRLSSTSSVGASDRSLRSFKTVSVTFLVASSSTPALVSPLLNPLSTIRDSPFTLGGPAGNRIPLQCAGGHSGAVHGLPPIADNLRNVDDSPAPPYSLDVASSSSPSFPSLSSDSVSLPASSDAELSPLVSLDLPEGVSVSALRRSVASSWSTFLTLSPSASTSKALRTVTTRTSDNARNEHDPLRKEESPPIFLSLPPLLVRRQLQRPGLCVR